MTEAVVQERPITSRQIVVGGVPIGGGAQIAVQSIFSARLASRAEKMMKLRSSLLKENFLGGNLFLS